MKRPAALLLCLTLAAPLLATAQTAIPSIPAATLQCADAAVSLSVSGSNEIRPGEWVTPKAMCLSSIPRRRTVATHYVRKVRNDLHMVYVNAAPNAAEMINCESFWNGAAFQLPCNTVNKADFLLAGQLDAPISSAVQGPCPQHAGPVGDHLTKKSNFQRGHGVSLSQGETAEILKPGHSKIIKAAPCPSRDHLCRESDAATARCLEALDACDNELHAAADLLPCKECPDCADKEAVQSRPSAPLPAVHTLADVAHADAIGVDHLPALPPAPRRMKTWHKVTLGLVGAFVAGIVWANNDDDHGGGRTRRDCTHGDC